MEPNQKSENKTGAPDYSQVPTFFKYCSDDERVIRGLFKDHKIRFTQPAALNDPLEFNPIIRFEHNGSNYTRYVFDGIMFPSEELRLHGQLIESQLNVFGILSLTKVPDSFDMWSRYANGHKGFLIELKPDFNKHSCMLSRDGPEYPVMEVTYVDEYAVNIDELVDEHGWIASAMVREKMLFTKTSRWQDEKEYRVVRELEDDPKWQPLGNKPYRDRNFYLFDFSLDCVESVTFEACMSSENKNKIIEACEGTEIKFLQAAIIRDRKDIWSRPASVVLIPAETFPNLLGMGDLGLFVEKKYLKEKLRPPITLSELNELPYYARNEEWVLQYYKYKKAKQKNRPTSLIE